jgi:hypothetical protein
MYIESNRFVMVGKPLYQNRKSVPQDLVHVPDLRLWLRNSRVPFGEQPIYRLIYADYPRHL